MSSLTRFGTPFFGIGAMRAGTSWLSELLGTHPDCGMPPYKELHFFDVRYGKYSGAEYYRAKANGLAQFGRSAARRIEAALDKMDTEEENATALESDTDELHLAWRRNPGRTKSGSSFSPKHNWKKVWPESQR